MKTSERRTLLAEGVIVAGVIVGAYSVLLEPLHKQWRHLASLTIDADSHAALRLGDPATITLERNSVRRAMEDLALLEASGRIARDELLAIEAIAELANASGVEIVDLRRRDVEDEIAISTPPAAGSSTTTPTKPVHIAFELDVRGEYGSLARFANGIESGFGLARIDAMALFPEGHLGHPMVRAAMATRHIALDTEPTLKALSAADAALHQLEPDP